jgi:hypothetical protein
VIGAVPVLGFAALLVWQLVTLIQTRHPAPLPAALSFPVLLAAALGGLALAVTGVLGVKRQRAAQRTAKQQREDRLRRVQDYRRDDVATDTLDGRREPFIASPHATPAPRRASAQG